MHGGGESMEKNFSDIVASWLWLSGPDEIYQTDNLYLSTGLVLSVLYNFTPLLQQYSPTSPVSWLHQLIISHDISDDSRKPLPAAFLCNRIVNCKINLLMLIWDWMAELSGGLGSDIIVVSITAQCLSVVAPRVLPVDSRHQHPPSHQPLISNIKPIFFEMIKNKI